MKATFNPFHLVAGMAADVTEEITDLETAISEKDVDRVRHLYKHIDSLLVGINYAIGYTLEQDIRAELEDAIKELRERLEANKVEAMQLSWSERLGALVRISGVVDVHGVLNLTAEIVGKTTLHAHNYSDLVDQLRKYREEAAA